jgi:hypothetical protein
MKTKRRIKRRTRQLKQKRSLKQKNRTKRIGGVAGAMRGLEHAVNMAKVSGVHATTSIAGVTKNVANTIRVGANVAGKGLQIGQMIAQGTAETAKRGTTVVTKTAEATPRIAGNITNLGINLTSDVSQLIATSLSASFKILIRTTKLIAYLATETETNLIKCGANDNYNVNEFIQSYTTAHGVCLTNIINTSVERAISVKKADVTFTLGQIDTKKAMIENLLLQLKCSKGRIYGYTKGCDVSLKKTLQKTYIIIKNLKTQLQFQLKGHISKLESLKLEWELRRSSFQYLKDNGFNPNQIIIMPHIYNEYGLNVAFMYNAQIRDLILIKYIELPFYIKFQTQLDAIINFLNEEIDKRETEEQLEKKKADNEALVKKMEEDIKNIAAVEKDKPIETSETSENSLNELIQEQDNLTQTLTSESAKINEEMSATIKENANTSKNRVSQPSSVTTSLGTKTASANNAASLPTNSASQPSSVTTSPPKAALLANNALPNEVLNPLRVNSNKNLNTKNLTRKK